MLATTFANAPFNAVSNTITEDAVTLSSVFEEEPALEEEGSRVSAFEAVDVNNDRRVAVQVERPQKPETLNVNIARFFVSGPLAKSPRNGQLVPFNELLAFNEDPTNRPGEGFGIGFINPAKRQQPIFNGKHGDTPFILTPKRLEELPPARVQELLKGAVLLAAEPQKATSSIHSDNPGYVTQQIVKVTHPHDGVFLLPKVRNIAGVEPGMSLMASDGSYTRDFQTHTLGDEIRLYGDNYQGYAIVITPKGYVLRVYFENGNLSDPISFRLINADGKDVSGFGSGLESDELLRLFDSSNVNPHAQLRIFKAETATEAILEEGLD